MNEEKKEPTIVEAKNENVISQYDEVQVAKKVERTDSFYDGKLLEIIGYSILSYIITIFTLGLASAWAEKLLIAYNVEHTVYNGKRLKFEGTGASLFVQKFKWIFFTIITLGIYSFWIPIKKQKWISSNIHYEKEEFVKELKEAIKKRKKILADKRINNIKNYVNVGITIATTIVELYNRYKGDNKDNK